MVKINNLLSRGLSDAVRRVLRDLFSEYERVDIQKEFTDGMGGGDVFLVRCVGQHGSEAPSIVKIDKTDRITYEERAFRQCIRHKLPNAAVVRKLSTPPEAELGGLWYSFIGAGTFDIISLYAFYQVASVDLLRRVLKKRLFTSLDRIWNEQTISRNMRLQTAYNTVLPPNLVVRWVAPRPDQTPITLTPQTIHTQPHQLNDYVCLKSFWVARLYDNNAALLTMPNNDLLPISIRLEDMPEEEFYLVNYSQPSPVYAVIQSTRQQDMADQTQAAMGAGFDLTAPHYPIPPLGHLPNPLLAIPDILSKSLDVYHACIHGDLHLLNVLVDLEGHMPHLIDFTHAQKTHVLRDLLHLEMAFVTHILPSELAQAGLDETVIVDLYGRLHVAVTEGQEMKAPAGLDKFYTTLLTIRQTAQRYLFYTHKWDEYYYGLILYLMGALRFGDLDRKETAPLNKQVAFWGAATALKLCQTPANQKLYKGEPKQIAPNPKKVSPTPTALHDPFTPYEIGLQNLLLQLDNAHSRYTEALRYDQQLRDNLTRSRRFGYKETYSSGRAEIIDQLNELTLTTLGVSFNSLCY